MLAAAKRSCASWSKEPGVVSAVVFKACLIPPGKGRLLRERPERAKPARYDVVILLEAASPDVINRIQASPLYSDLLVFIRTSARHFYTTTASNVKRIASVDHERPGVFLFNYFFADDVQQNVQVWEYTAGWFQQETGLDNSTVLLPDNAAQSPYAIINHCRWNRLRDILPSLLLKPSFHRYVLDNFYANKVAAMPILYRLA